MNVTRDKSIDWLKGLTIFLVVVGHELQWCTFHLDRSQLLINGNLCLVQQWISSFHMPLLFFLSGFLIGYKRTTELNTWSDLGRNILRKVQTLLLPGAAWMIVKHFVQGGWYIEWFLKVLFIIFVVFILVRFAAHLWHFSFGLEAFVHFVLFCSLIVFAHYMKGTPLYSHLCLRQVGNYYPYVVLGCFFAARGWNKKVLEKDWIYAASLLLFALSFGLYEWRLFDTSWAVYIMPYVIALSAIVTLYVIGVKITQNLPPPLKCAGNENSRRNMLYGETFISNICDSFLFFAGHSSSGRFLDLFNRTFCYESSSHRNTTCLWNSCRHSGGLHLSWFGVHYRSEPDIEFYFLRKGFQEEQ